MLLAQGRSALCDASCLKNALGIVVYVIFRPVRAKAIKSFVQNPTNPPPFHFGRVRRVFRKTYYGDGAHMAGDNAISGIREFHGWNSHEGQDVMRFITGDKRGYTMEKTATGYRVSGYSLW